MKRSIYIIVDNFEKSFVNKNIGLFAKYLYERGISVKFLSNLTSDNQDINSIHGGIPIIKLKVSKCRNGVWPLHAWRYYLFLLAHPLDIGCVWLYKYRNYAGFTALWVKLWGGKVILKLDSARGVARGAYFLSCFCRFIPWFAKYLNPPHIAPGTERYIPDDVQPAYRSSRLDRRLYWLNVPRRLWGLTRALFFDYHLLADVILCEAPELKRELWIYDVGGKCVLYPNALNIAQFSITAEQLSNEGLKKQKWILSVGRIVRSKGFDTGIKAFAQIPENIRIGWKYKIVGPVQDQVYFQELLKLIEEIGLSDIVEVVPGVYGDALYRLYAQAQILFMPYPGLGYEKGIEGQPNAVVEAMFFRNVVVVTRVGTVDFLLNNGECGLLLPPDDIRAMTEAMVRLLQDESLRQILIEKAEQYVTRNLNLEKNIHTVLERLGWVELASRN